MSTEQEPVRPGEIYRHYKGNLYMVLSVADYTGSHTECGEDHERYGVSANSTGFPEGEKLVVYVGLYNNPKGNRPCARPLSEWHDNVLGVPGTAFVNSRRYERCSL